ncbi:sugar transferase [Rhodococcus opacus M213]|uniref:Sugar transferase n=1 Tax=Rhodococcus opacus M213 TaxID=1129896 RepID=K8XMS1_RHOOP|nr:sugar transferase [Rhodococcus opacus]EKT82729.1 sugar transferase [Rhodococcus opacus M213]
MTTSTRRILRIGPSYPRPPTTRTVRHSADIVPDSLQAPTRLLARRRAQAYLLPLAADFIVLSVVCSLTRIDRPAQSAAIIVAILAFTGAYRPHLTLSLLDTLPRLALASTLAALATALVLTPNGTLVGAAKLAAVTLLAVVLSRNATYPVERFLRRKLRGGRRTVIIGGGPVAKILADSIVTEPSSGLQLIGLLDDSPHAETARNGNIPITNLREYLTTHYVDTAVLAFPHAVDGTVIHALRECDRIDCEIFVVPRLWEMTAVTGDMEHIGTVPLKKFRRAAHRSFLWRVKLWMGRVLSAAMLVALAPTFLAIALAVYLSDRSAPVLFRQKRVGLDDRVFELLKFRTMSPASDHESATHWCIAHDARIGRLGRILRATSLDELPQLWNVIRGDMTLVGPRPERPHFVDKFHATVPNYEARHRVPAGITGWAAVNGLRGDTSIGDRTRFDNYYIENWSMWFDVKVLLMTVVAVVRLGGK